MQDVHGSFDDNESANAAVQALLDRGFPSDDVHVVERRGHKWHEAPVVWSTRAMQWGAGGGAAGAVLGAVLAPLLLRIEQPTLQRGLDYLLSAEGWPVALQGAFLGAIALGIIGVMVGIGTWRNDAELHDDAERVWVGVRTNQGELRRATEALRQVGARRLE